MSELKSYGQIGYEAYAAKTGWKSLATGQMLPTWDALRAEIRDAWDTAAEAIVADYIDASEPGRPPICE